MTKRIKLFIVATVLAIFALIPAGTALAATGVDCYYNGSYRFCYDHDYDCWWWVIDGNASTTCH